MKALIYYITWPLVYVTASLPFSALYRVSDLLCLVFKMTGYRRTVILTNLRNSFPEKSPTEIRKIASEYYRYVCDVIVESLKAMKMDDLETRKRCITERIDWLDKLHAQGRSVILVTGHYGNWEWASACVKLNTPYDLAVIYRPLSNNYFDNLVAGMRSRFGIRIIPETRTLREMAANRKKITATAFVADQSAPRDYAYWTTFLNQDTSIYTGPEKLARKFNYPVVFVSMRRIRRGYYKMVTELLCENPDATKDGEISEAFARRLEQDILDNPVTWLWSHKRWKHQRPESSPSQRLASSGS